MSLATDFSTDKKTWQKMRRNLTLSCHTCLGAHRREPSTTCAENLSNRVEINSTPRILGILIMNSKDF